MSSNGNTDRVKSVMHEHLVGVVIPLTTTTWRMHLPEGTSAEYSTEANVSGWADAVVHMPENVSDETGEVILVELKKHHMKNGHENHDYENEEDHDDAD